MDWKERCGQYRIQFRKGSQRIWIHAVSVGEVMASLSILRELREFAPDAEIVLSVTTSSGHQTAREKAEGLYDHLVYFPIDVPRFVLGAIVKVRPTVIGIMETELWMNFNQIAKNFGIPVLMINGRVSDRSFPRSMKIRAFYKALLKNVKECLMQSAIDRDRILALGAVSAEVFGNCKFDESVTGTEVQAEDWRSELGIKKGDRVLVIGSTRGEFEEDFVLQALALCEEDWDRVIHAPRHLERVSGLAEKVTVRFGEVGLRSQKDRSRYVLLDTYGELSQVYCVADVVVVGGGFDQLGGQNIIQPLAHGKPVVHGPNMQNFRDVSEMARHAGSTFTAATPEELAQAISDLIRDEAKRKLMGDAAKQLVTEQMGASRKYAERLVSYLKEPSS